MGIHTRLSGTEGISAACFVEVVKGKVFLGEEMGWGGLGDLEWFLSKSLFSSVKRKHRRCGPSSCSAHRWEAGGGWGGGRGRDPV